MRKLLLLFIFLSLQVCSALAQQDSVEALQQLPTRYLRETSDKIDLYVSRTAAKTEKTLARLSRWESRIKELIQKINPAAAANLFSPNQMSFERLLAKYKAGALTYTNYKVRYDQQRDKLTTQLLYLDSNRNLLKKVPGNRVRAVRSKAMQMDSSETQNEALQQMIRDRKQQLIAEVTKHLGKNKYLQKINKESYYYIETLRNYKELFNNTSKREEMAKKLLEEIPGFSDFIRKNSMLASLFKLPEDYGIQQSLAGLQTSVSVNSLIQARVAAGGPTGISELKQNIQAAQVQLNQLKDKLIKAGGASSDTEMPDFKPNTQKTKTFRQRIEYGFNLQFGKRNSLLPGTADVGLSLGYKLNDKSVIGIGAGYKLGIGSIEKIRFTHEGIGLRTFVDWRLKKQFFVSGGFEMNHHASFKNIEQLKDKAAWQRSGLIGISKKISLKTKFSRGTKLQLMYDMLHQQHVPMSNAFVFRIGYDLK